MTIVRWIINIIIYIVEMFTGPLTVKKKVNEEDLEKCRAKVGEKHGANRYYEKETIYELNEPEESNWKIEKRNIFIILMETENLHELEALSTHIWEEYVLGLISIRKFRQIREMIEMRKGQLWTIQNQLAARIINKINLKMNQARPEIDNQYDPLHVIHPATLKTWEDSDLSSSIFENLKDQMKNGRVREDGSRVLEFDIEEEVLAQRYEPRGVFLCSARRQWMQEQEENIKKNRMFEKDKSSQDEAEAYKELKDRWKEKMKSIGHMVDRRGSLQEIKNECLSYYAWSYLEQAFIKEIITKSEMTEILDMPNDLQKSGWSIILESPRFEEASKAISLERKNYELMSDKEQIYIWMFCSTYGKNKECTIDGVKWKIDGLERMFESMQDKIKQYHPSVNTMQELKILATNYHTLSLL